MHVRYFVNSCYVYRATIVRRQCNTAEGSLECWTKTTDGFSYGLATSMIDFCQVILKVRGLAAETVG